MSASTNRFVYCIEDDCEGSGRAGAFAPDPDCPECGAVMTDPSRAAAAIGPEAADTVARKANNDPDNTPGGESA